MIDEQAKKQEVRNLTVPEFFQQFPMIKQSHFAKQLGVSSTWISAINRDHREPTDDLIDKMNIEIKRLAHQLLQTELV